MRFKRRWRKNNTQNFTEAGCCYDAQKVKVGKYSYGELNVYMHGVSGEQLSIGNFVSIANNVTFLLAGGHQVSAFSTYPYRRKLLHGDPEATTKGPIIVEDEVWIGFGATILSGITIATGTIIGTGSVVTKSTTPFSIWAGNPAKEVKKRFRDERVLALMSFIDYGKLDQEFIARNISFLYSELTYEGLVNLLPELKEMGAFRDYHI